MSSLRVGSIAGIAVRIHVSWAIILALIAATVATQASSFDASVTAFEAWSVGIGVALGFLISAVVHELAHALVARRCGAAPGGVIVHFLGTVASPAVEVPRPRDEFLIAVAGPLATIALGIASLAVALVTERIGGELGLAVAAISLVVGTLDVAIGLIGLVPAYPLDGGRAVRAIAWARTGEPRGALRVAAGVGRIAGGVTIGFGIVAIVLLQPIDGIMIAIGGWFLMSAARGVERRAAIDDALEGVVVRDVMDRDVPTLPPGLTIDTFADQVLGGTAALAYPVVRGSELLGLIGAAQLRRVPSRQRATVRVADVMIRPPDLPVLDPDASLQDAVDGLARTGLDGLPVVEGGRLTGLVSRRNLAAEIRSRTERAGISPW